MHKQKSVLENEIHEIHWDLSIFTAKTIITEF